MADPKPLRPPAKILRVLGHADPVLERTIVGIYDYLDSLTSVAYQQALAIAPVVTTTTPAVVETQRRARDGDDGDDADDAYARPGAPGTNGTPGRRGGDGEDGEDGSDGYSRAGGGGITQLTGDVTAGPGSGSLAATNVNAPDGFTLAGKVIATAISGPASPAAGKLSIWADAGNANLFCKNPAGVVNHGVQSRAFSANLFLASLLDDGTLQVAQPAFSGITGQAVTAQITNNAITYAKIQQVSTGLRVLGSLAGGAQDVSELSLGGVLAISGSVLTTPLQWSATWGGYQYAISGAMPIFVGVGPTSYSSTSGVYAFVAPAFSVTQSLGIRVGANTLTGTGSLDIKLFVNGATVGTIANVALGGTGSFVQALAATINAGDRLEIQLASFGGAITGGDVTFHVTGAFR